MACVVRPGRFGSLHRISAVQGLISQQYQAGWLVPHELNIDISDEGRHDLTAAPLALVLTVRLVVDVIAPLLVVMWLHGN